MRSGVNVWNARSCLPKLYFSLFWDQFKILAIDQIFLKIIIQLNSFRHRYLNAIRMSRDVLIRLHAPLIPHYPVSTRHDPPICKGIIIRFRYNTSARSGDYAMIMCKPLSMLKNIYKQPHLSKEVSHKEERYIFINSLIYPMKFLIKKSFTFPSSCVKQNDKKS